MQKDIKIFCDNLKQLRMRENLTLAEMAKRLTISTQSLTKLESGTLPSQVSMTILFTIENQFGITPMDMLTPYFFISDDDT